MGPPPPPVRHPKPQETAPLPRTERSNPAASPSGPLEREGARDTLAPSSFGKIGAAKPVPTAPAPAPTRAARAPMPTLGDLEGASATATLRPPGAVPPPPRALPMATPSQPDVDATVDLTNPNETPLPFAGSAAPLSPSTDLSPRGPARTAQALGSGPRAAPPPALGSAPRTEPVIQATPATGTPRALIDAALATSGTVVSGAPAPKPFATDQTLESTLDMGATASKKATQAALVAQTRISTGPDEPRISNVPAPGLFIADEPREPRPQQLSLATANRQVVRMRTVVLALGGVLLMLVGAIVVLLVRRGQVQETIATSASAAPPPPPGCSLSAPPSRISPIERAVPISTVALSDGSVTLAIADTKTSAAAYTFDPVRGEAKRIGAQSTGTSEVSHVTAGTPLTVDRVTPDFAFGQSIAADLALGVGPAGLLRRGIDGATGQVWALPTGARITPPRVVSFPIGHFVAFRQGGADGQIVSGWLRLDGSASGELTAVEGAPKSLGTPNVSSLGHAAVVLFSARADKSEPYRVYAAVAKPGERATAASVLDLPAEGGGAIAPSLTLLAGDRYLVQWTDGNVGQYAVHVRMLGAGFKPLTPPLLVSPKGANAGQGTLVTTSSSSVSFFIQTTAGHDELWGVTVSCH